jgi:hypothetical protein
MSVYKEGYYIIDEIERASYQIYPDAADYGAPVVKGDKLWNAVGQLYDWYGDKETRRLQEYGTGKSVEFVAELVVEGDYRKGEYDYFKIEYHTSPGCHTGGPNGTYIMDGYLVAYKL